MKQDELDAIRKRAKEVRDNWRGLTFREIFGDDYE